MEIVRSILGAADQFDAIAGRSAPDAQFDLTRALGPFRGAYDLAGWRRMGEDFEANWEFIRCIPDEFISAGERVVTPFTFQFKGRDGIEVQARGVYVWELRDGLIAQCTLYQERAEALEAAGLRR